MKLKEKLRPYNIILASASPRRKQLVTDLGLDFTIRSTDIDEVFPTHLKEKEIALYLAKKKANAFSDLEINDLIITCDTIVWHDGMALEKPTTKTEAQHMLKKLSATTHEVISAVCIKTLEKKKLFFDSTQVSFGTLYEEDIDYYIDHYKPFDKAGAYGIQEWIGLIGIEKINGSYTNVVGMPMEKLYKNLIQF